MLASASSCVSGLSICMFVLQNKTEDFKNCHVLLHYYEPLNGAGGTQNYNYFITKQELFA